jgi:hypothetical protein
MTAMSNSCDSRRSLPLGSCMLFHRMPQNAVQHISLAHGFGKVFLDYAVVIVHEEMRSL